MGESLSKLIQAVSWQTAEMGALRRLPCPLCFLSPGTGVPGESLFVYMLSVSRRGSRGRHVSGVCLAYGVSNEERTHQHCRSWPQPLWLKILNFKFLTLLVYGKSWVAFPYISCNFQYSNFGWTSMVLSHSVFCIPYLSLIIRNNATLPFPGFCMQMHCTQTRL